MGLRSALLLISYSLVSMVIGMIYSLQAPFFPTEAETKNATALEYGLVFSSYELIQIVGTPLIGAYLTKVGTMKAFIFGAIGSSVSTALFGFVSNIDNRTLFITTSMILRIIDSFTSGVVYVAILVLINPEIGGTTAKNMVFGLSIYGIGMSIGPAVGSIFYNLGGFTTPFVVVGCLQILVTFFTLFSLRFKKLESKVDIVPEKVDKKTVIISSLSVSLSFVKVSKATMAGDADSNEFGYNRLLRTPRVLVYCFCTIVSAQSTTFVLTILEPNLRQYDLTTTAVGLVFLFNGASYAFGFISLAIFSHKTDKIQIILFTGVISVVISSVIIGPIPFLDFEQELWLTCLSLMLLSSGAAVVQSSANILCLQEALSGGFPDDDLTSALVTGIFLENLGIGSFTGPIISGLLFDNFGFRNATLFLTFVNLLSMAWLISTIHVPDRQAKIKFKDCLQDFDETNALLPNSHLHSNFPDWRNTSVQVEDMLAHFSHPYIAKTKLSRSNTTGPFSHNSV